MCPSPRHSRGSTRRLDFGFERTARHAPASSRTFAWLLRPCPPPRPRTTRFRSTEPTTSSSTSATRSRRRTTIAARSASSSSATAVPRRACATARATCSQQGKIRLVLTTPLRPDGDDRRARAASTATACKDIALWVDDARDAFATAVERGAKPAHEPTRHARRRRRGRDRRDPHLRRHDPLARRAAELPRRCSCPASCAVDAALSADAESGSSTSTTASATSSSGR